MKRQLGLFCIAALAASGQAFADTTWSLTGTGATLNTSTGEISAKVSGGTVTATVSGWANTRRVYNASPDDFTLQKQTYGSSTGLRQWGGGVGMYNLDRISSTTPDSNEGTEPEHGIDNNERFEMVLVKLSSAMILSGFEIGYPTSATCNGVPCDSDMTVMAYTGSGDPTNSSDAAFLGGKTWGSLTAASGWTVVANYANVAAGGVTPTGLTTSSSYWLIGAANTLVPTGSGLTCSSGTRCGCGTGTTCDWDYVKLLALVGTQPGPGPGPTPTPEPGSLALFGLALAGMVSVAKRRKV